MEIVNDYPETRRIVDLDLDPKTQGMSRSQMSFFKKNQASSHSKNLDFNDRSSLKTQHMASRTTT